MSNRGRWKGREDEDALDEYFLYVPRLNLAGAVLEYLVALGLWGDGGPVLCRTEERVWMIHGVGRLEERGPFIC